MVNPMVEPTYLEAFERVVTQCRVEPPPPIEMSWRPSEDGLGIKVTVARKPRQKE